MWMKYISAIVIAGLIVSGCTDTRTKRDQTDRIRAQVADLQNEQLVIMDMGSYFAVGTKNTKAIIASGDVAIPVLVEALQNDDAKPVLLGYVAYCLRQMHSTSGERAANNHFDKLMKKGETITPEERFARNELGQYLDSFKQSKTLNRQKNY
jgi:hypothetical protein